MIEPSPERPTKWGVSFALRSEPLKEVHVERWLEATDELDAVNLAWQRGQAKGKVSVGTHEVRGKPWKIRGAGFAAGYGKQKQELAPPKAAPGSLDAMVAALAAEAARQAVEAVDAKVNPDVIREVCRDIVAEALKGIPPKEMTLRVNDRPPVKLKGRQHKMLDTIVNLIATPMANGDRLNVALMGPTGSGKTHLAGQVADALAIIFERPMPLASVSFNGATTEGELVGRLFPAMDGPMLLESPVAKVYAEGGVILCDEMDAGDGNMLLRLNEATANGWMTLPNGNRIKKHNQCFFLAGINTAGNGATRMYNARTALDKATKSRWWIEVVEYDLDLETDMVKAYGLNGKGDALLTEWRRIRQAADGKVHQPVGMREACQLAHVLAVGRFTEVRDAIAAKIADWSADERRVVGY